MIFLYINHMPICSSKRFSGGKIWLCSYCCQKDWLTYCIPVLQERMQFIALSDSMKQARDAVMMDICLHGHLSYFEPTYHLSRLQPLVWLLALLTKCISMVTLKCTILRHNVPLKNSLLMMERAAPLSPSSPEERWLLLNAREYKFPSPLQLFLMPKISGSRR